MKKLQTTLESIFNNSLVQSLAAFVKTLLETSVDAGLLEDLLHGVKERKLLLDLGNGGGSSLSGGGFSGNLATLTNGVNMDLCNSCKESRF